MSYGDRKDGQVSAFDVSRALKELARTHGGDAGVALHPPARETQGVALLVRVWFKRQAGTPDAPRVYERGTSGQWPTRECKTITGLLLRLAIELDVKLGEETAASEAQRRFKGI